jgi:polyhydroxyalkanoate synthesis regulator phasin
MKSILWFVIGIAAGFAIAHQVNKTEQGKRFFDELNKKAQDFGEAVGEGYRKREAELRDALEGAGETISDLS